MNAHKMERRMTALQQTVEKEVQEYTYYNEKLIEDSYASGDIYDNEATGDKRQGWEVLSTQDRPYLAHIKSLSDAWPSLRLLADFMEIGTSPARWNGLEKKPPKERDLEIQERASRTTITRLDYLPSGVVPRVYNTSKKLKEALENEAQETEASKGRFRLYIVEDLSRDVIELLGGHYDIEPAFFREQIFDYAWYNTRDRWVDSPRLNVTTKTQRWLQLRFPSIRYYKSPEDFVQGGKEYDAFNVLRRHEDDINNKSKWDDQNALVGLARTRGSLWLSGEGRAGKARGSIGVLLCDPTPKCGRTLWYGYRNWENSPSLFSKQSAPKGPPRTSIYNDIVYWAKRTDAFNPSASHMKRLNKADGVHVPIQALLHLISAEWLEIGQYIRTRLGQIEWEISFPEHFLIKDKNVNDTLKKLHIWRRLVPLYREMLTETLQRAFQFPCHPSNPGPSALPETTDSENESSATTPTIPNNANPTDVDLSRLNSIPNATSSDPSTTTHHTEGCQCQKSTHLTSSLKCGPVTEMREDFVRILGYMVEYQNRIDRLTSVVTAIISMQDSQRSREDNKNVARLTWLATFFIPLSFVASLFSMTEDISSIKETIKWYFATSLPLALLSLGLAMILTLPSVKEAREGHLKWWRKLFAGLRGEGRKNK